MANMMKNRPFSNNTQPPDVHYINGWLDALTTIERVVTNVGGRISSQMLASEIQSLRDMIRSMQK
jgi:hypothetical protein